jgi:hypothetical protein
VQLSPPASTTGIDDRHRRAASTSGTDRRGIDRRGIDRRGIDERHRRTQGCLVLPWERLQPAGADVAGDHPALTGRKL